MSTPTSLQLSLARQVVELAAREGWGAGQVLAEAPLSLRFGVSRTPMRKALQILQHRGILDFTPQRGFSLMRHLTADDAREDGADDLLRNLLRDRATGLIPREMSENFLLDRYHVSRGILRDRKSVV